MTLPTGARSMRRKSCSSDARSAHTPCHCIVLFLKPTKSPVHLDCGIACKQIALTQTVPEGFFVHPDSFARDCCGAALSYTLVRLPSQSHVAQMLGWWQCAAFAEVSVIFFHFLLCSGMLLRQMFCVVFVCFLLSAQAHFWDRVVT